MSPSLIDALGYAAASCTTFSFIPQAWRVWRTRSAHDISTPMYVLFITGVALWLAYGVVLCAMPIIIANSVTVLLAGSILGMKWRFERNEHASAS